MTDEVPQFPREVLAMTPRTAAMRPYPDPDPCLMRPDRPHVCRRPDHDERHGKTTPKETT